MSTHVIIPDPHSTPGVSNERAIWAGRLINDVKPDVVIVMGDTADMASLCSYDRNTRNFQGRSYKADIDCHADFQDKLWSTVRAAKRKLPRAITLIGNHEQRIERAINVQPELEGTISYRDLELDEWYDDVVPYNGASPGSISVDGVSYLHYAVSGVSGRPISSEHQAHALLQKNFSSTTVGHQHTFDWTVRTGAGGGKLMGLCCGVFQEHSPGFAGEAAKLWWRGLVIKRNVDKGAYDLQAVSMDALRKEYKW